jgi:hypothetical protein
MGGHLLEAIQYIYFYFYLQVMTGKSGIMAFPNHSVRVIDMSTNDTLTT